MRKLVITITLLWLFCLPVAAKPFYFAGIGEVDWDPHMIVKQDHSDKGDMIYKLIVKDGDVWRGASIYFPYNIPNNKSIIKLDAFLDKMIDEKARTDASIIAVDKAEFLKIGNKKIASKSIRTNPGSSFIIANINTLLISTDDGIKMTMFTCVDGDVQYWRPFLYKLVSATP